MTRHAKIHAALIQPQSRSRDVKPVLDAAARVLARRDPRRDGPPFRIPARSAVHGDRFAVRVTHDEQSDFGPRIGIAVQDRYGDDIEEAAAILSDVVLDALRDCAADVIEWMRPGAFIDRDEFITLKGYVARTRRPPADDGWHGAWVHPAPLRRGSPIVDTGVRARRLFEACIPTMPDPSGARAIASILVTSLAVLIAPAVVLTLLLYGVARNLACGAPAQADATGPEAGAFGTGMPDGARLPS